MPGGSGQAARPGLGRVEAGQSRREAETPLWYNKVPLLRSAGRDFNPLLPLHFVFDFVFLFFFFFLPPMKIKFVSSISVFIYLFLGVSSP